ncbi:MAG TPA: PH domain-containing protein [Fimbriimonadaceae bacterium]|nr:PH domain-containing protein [Fimbriimonadaceae bacterium]
MFDKPHRLHPASIIINFGHYFVATLKSLGVPLAAAIFSGRHSSSDYVLLIIALGVAVTTGISLVGPVLHFFSTTFYIEGEALVISSGFVWRKRRTIPLSRIQNVNIERTIWHRLLGAAAVKVETAAGHKGEGDLAALSEENAAKLQSVLLHRAAPVPAAPAAEAPLYQLSLRQVLLAGALENRVMYIVGSIAAVFQTEGSSKLVTAVTRYLQQLGTAASIVVSTLTVFALILVGWLLSIVISATRFYGFRIEKHPRGLLLLHGLITQFKTIVPIGRVQDVRIVEPLFFRLFGYCEVYADTAGSFDRKDAAGANKVCPILPESEVSLVGRLLLPEFAYESLSWQQVSPKTVGRHAWRYFVLFAILLGWPLGHWLGWHALWAIVPIAPWCWLLGVVYYRYVGYSFTNDILASRSGVFRRHAVLIPFDRIQHYSVNSSLVQRWLGLTTVTAISAASGGHPIHVVDMPARDAEVLREVIGASIHSHLGSRRGGL